MIRTLRVYFLSRLLREKILLLGFILIGTLWWLSAFGGRASKFWRDQHNTTVTLKDQQQWLDNRVAIETAAQKSAARLEPAKTLDRTRLTSAVSQAASEAGLRNNYSSTSGGSDTNGQFTVHTIDFTVTNGEYEMLERFYLNLHQRAPYIGIEQFSLSARPNDPSKLNLALRVSSVESPR